MSKFIIVFGNGESYGGGEVFNRKELDNVFKEWSEGEDMIDEDGDVVEVIDLIRYGFTEIHNECMCERGDDYIDIKVIQLSL